MNFQSPRSAWFWTVAAIVGVGSLIGGKAMMAAGVSLHQHGPCPTSVDGVCIPSRASWGYYPTKWRTWPGVSPKPTAADVPPPLPPGIAPFEAPSPAEEAAVVPPPPTTETPATEPPAAQGRLPGPAVPPADLPGEGLPQEPQPGALLPDPFQDDPGQQDPQDPAPDLPPELQELLREPEGDAPFPGFGPLDEGNPGGGLGIEKHESSPEANPLRTAASPPSTTDIAANFKARSTAGWSQASPSASAEPPLAEAHSNPLRRQASASNGGAAVQQTSHEQGATLGAPSFAEPPTLQAGRTNPLRAR